MYYFCMKITGGIMDYSIYYREVFSTKDKVLTGYDMFCKEGTDEVEGFSSIKLKNRDTHEYRRLVTMLKHTEDPIDKISFVERTPMEVVMFLRGVFIKSIKSSVWKEVLDGCR